ncbi:MAG: ThuA domain-containing protein [Thermoguttaceae bacterium]
MNLFESRFHIAFHSILTCCVLTCWGWLFSILIGSSVSLAAEKDTTKTEPKQVRVMIVTGIDYPGHPWKSQAIELRKALESSPLLDVRLVDDIEILGTDVIFDYDVLFCNFKNYDPLKRETAAKENMLRFIRGGGGLMYFHFSGGAFQNWPEFETIAGRIWNPSFRGHDPFQEFTVQITKPEHPIMRGIGNFNISDELYTCLDGKKEIDILAEAKSSVDGKMYPMTFTFTEGKGRGFHTVLGHNEKAFAPPEVTKMLQQAVIWCAGRE